MIDVTDLTVRYGSFTAVDRLSFTAPAGRVTGFLGANGAGKSSALGALLGLVPTAGGTVTLGGVSFRDLPDPARTVGALLSATAFHPARTGAGTLRLAASATGTPTSRVDEMLALVGLERAARKRVGEYSLGMRQRLGVAHALLARPSVLVFDEPANGLDPEGIRWLRGLLRDYADQGATVLVSSHLLAEMELMAHRLVVIDRGSLLVEGDLEEIVRGEGTAVTASDPEALHRELAGSTLAWHPTPTGAHVEATPLEVGRLARDRGLVLTHLAEARPALEDVFVRLTRHTA